MPYDVLDPSLAADAPTTTAGAPLEDNGETFANIRAEIVLMLGNRADVTTTYLVNLKRWTNWGYRNVAQMLDLKELWASVAFDLVTDQNLYTVPASLSWIKRMMIQDDTDYVDDGGIELQMIDEMTYRNLPDSDEVQLSGSAVPPDKYFRYGRMIVLWPTPALAYTAPVDFRVRPTDLVEDDDCPMLPPEFSEVIMLAGLMRAQRALGMRQQAALTQNDMLSALRPLLNTDAEETSAMHMVAQPIRSIAQLRRTRTD